MRFISAGSDQEFFEEIATTSNISREGLYFLSNREHYQEGMQLSVTLPYHSPLYPGAGITSLRLFG
jgi:hypothetical protein